MPFHAHDFYKPPRIFLTCHYLWSTFDNMWNENVLGNHLQDFRLPREKSLISWSFWEYNRELSQTQPHWTFGAMRRNLLVSQNHMTLEKKCYPKVMHSRILLTVVIERLICSPHKFQRWLNEPAINSSNFCVTPWEKKIAIELKATIITDCRLFLH